MNTEIQVNSSNIQNILIALVLISAIIYGFIEFRKVNIRVQELENKLKNIEEGFSTSMSDGDETQQYPPEFYQMMAQQEMMQEQKEQQGQQRQSDEQPVDKEQQNEVLNTIVEEQVEEVNDEQQTIKRFDVSNKRVLSMINNDVEVSKKGNNESIEDITDIPDDDASAPATAAPAAAAPAAAAPAAAAPAAAPAADTAAMSNEIDISEPLLEVSSDIMNQYKDSTIKELKDKLTELGLSTTGSKTKLVQRLAENQN